ncbi:MAG: hypothetical protein ABI461_22180 [Polyangiaceae bacterium]
MVATRALVLLGFACFAVTPALTGLTACTAGTSSTNCALDTTCTSGADLKTYINLTRDQMATATITACLNGGCDTGTPASIPSSPGDRLAINLNGALSIQGFISSPDPIKGYLIEANFILSDSNPMNGDAYQLYATSNGQQASGSINQTATYTKTTPNGADCPPVCENATIDQTK